MGLCSVCLFPHPISIHDFPTSRFLLAIPMSAGNQTAGPSTDNFTAIFDAATTEYQRLTGRSLDNHPFSAQLDTCQNPDAVSNLLRTQAQAFSKFRKGDERLMAWLDPTIHILCTFSDTLGEGIGLVSKRRSFARLFSDIHFSAILACKNDFYWNQGSSRSMFPP